MSYDRNHNSNETVKTVTAQDDDEQQNISQKRRRQNGNDEHPSTSWKRWILDRLRRVLLAANVSDDRRLRHKLMTIATAMTVLGCYAGYRGRRRLLAPWRQRDDDHYQSALLAPLSLLLQAAKEGRIERALLASSGNGIFYLLNRGTEDITGLAAANSSPHHWRRTILPPSLSAKDLLETTLASCPDVSALPEPFWRQLATPFVAALPFVYLGFMYQYIIKPMLQNGGSDMPSDIHAQATTSSSSITFADVAGMDESTIHDIKEVVDYLHKPDRYRRVGAMAPRGILLHGAPGTGKTLLAQAVAGEANVDCFLACSASDFVEVFVGRGAARVRALFAQARLLAKRRHARSWWERLRVVQTSKRCSQTTPASAILFIDELDALGKTRATLNSNDEREQALNQLLVELDGFRRDSDNVTLVVMAASNRADVLDPAILRRFDRQIHVGLPDAAGREAILKVHARHIHSGPDIVWSRVASDAMTRGFSGAELRNVVNESALLAVRDGSLQVAQNHLDQAARRVNRMKRQSSGDSFDALQPR